MTTSTTVTDFIEKAIVIRATRARVWRALTTPAEFGAWFGASITGEFAEGQEAQVRIANPKYAHMRIVLEIARVEPQELFAYRWHPYPVDATYDYSKDRPTLVEFRLADHPEGIELTVKESGFDRVPLGRRAEAFRMNTDGWKAQLGNIERYVSTT